MTLIIKLVIHRKLVSKGRLFWKKEWFSVCSKHQYSDPYGSCETCRVGHWVNPYRRAIGSIFFKRYYGLWYWWVNRSSTFKHKDYFEGFFFWVWNLPESNKRKFYENYRNK